MDQDPPSHFSPSAHMEEEYLLQIGFYGEGFFEEDQSAFNSGLNDPLTNAQAAFSPLILNQSLYHPRSSKKYYSSIDEAKLMTGLNAIVTIGDSEYEDSKEFRSLDPTEIYPQRDINIQPLFEDQERVRKSSVDASHLEELINDYANMMKRTIQNEILKKTIKLLRHRVTNGDVHKFSQSLLSRAASSILLFSNRLSSIRNNHGAITHEALIRCMMEFALGMLSSAVYFLQSDFLPLDASAPLGPNQSGFMAEEAKTFSKPSAQKTQVSGLSQANIGENGGAYIPSGPHVSSLNGARGMPSSYTESSSIAASFLSGSVSNSVRVTGKTSVLGCEEARRSKKNWGEEEMRELSEMVARGPVHADRLQEFSSKYGRSETAVKSKIHKLKHDNKGTGILKRNNYSWGERDEISSASMSLFELKSSTIEEMVCASLRQFAEKIATREEIYSKINELYNIEATSKNIEATKRSIIQTLCTSNKIFKIKGTFSLSEKPGPSAFGEFIGANNFDAIPLKKKLQYVLSHFHGYFGTFEQIRNEYVRLFEPGIVHDQKQLQKCFSSINKALVQSREFDKSKSKTKYGLKASQEPFPAGFSRLESGASSSIEQEYPS